MTEKQSYYFHSLVNELGLRSARAFLSKLNPASTPLRAHLTEQFERFAGESGSFMADPVFESTFGWKEGDQTLGDLAGGLLSRDLVAAMDNPGHQLVDQRFAADWHPYQHQIESWQTLLAEDPQSVVVSSGTGSGKTECFLIPVLDDLARQASGGAPLEGVQALFLYPLNALINSQRDRLRAWTNPFGGKIRFCLYNGETPRQKRPQHERARSPEEVLSRTALWNSPPPLLITNSTMLEYMLVRSQDRPIIDKSKGRLRWIILDEAHTYVGSQAAEVALLLRRVLHTFDVEPRNVRFVATSATIGSGDGSRIALQQFLADIAGVPTSQVTVISGGRQIPPLPSVPQATLPSLEALEIMSSSERFAALAGSSIARNVRQRLSDEACLLSDISSIVTEGKVASEQDRQTTLRLLDLARTSEHDGQSFLPLRGHLFLRTHSGLWACIDENCPGKSAYLQSEDWGFGSIYIDRRDKCTHCNGLVYEVVFCSRCGSDYCFANEGHDGNDRMLSPHFVEHEDEEQEDTDHADDDDEDGNDEEDSRLVAHPRLLTRIHAKKNANIDPKSGFFRDSGGSHIAVVVPDDSRLRCPKCGEVDQGKGLQFRSARAGAPFFLGVSIPALLEHTPPMKSDSGHVLPSNGRRTITFTDSRQGTARFAIQTQLEAERNYVRSWIYHQLWSQLPSPATPEAIAEAQQAVAALEPLVKSNPSLQPVLRSEQEKLAAMTTTQPPELSWQDAVAHLANTPQLSMMRQYWKETGREDLENRRIAQFLLFREFARRPQYSTSLETLGLVSLSYKALSEIPESRLPAIWRGHEKTLDEWRAYLKIALDFHVRSNSAVDSDPLFLRWIGMPFRPKSLVSPTDEPGRSNVRWARVKSTKRITRIARLLFQFLGFSPDIKDHVQDVNDLLIQAWSELTHSQLLVRRQEGYTLNLEKSANLRGITSAWLCPVTRRALDTVLDGKSPYLTEHFGLETLCKRIDLPELKYPFLSHSGETVSKEDVRQWLDTDERIRSARASGLWTEFNDRLVQQVDYYQAGEHSAQQSSTRLRQLEDHFKAGRLNILSCSTTMEMGVDIGGLNAVAMNNAPPGPANFLQRAGRAGRRGETASSSLTMCKAVPHGQAVFKNPLWPFRTPIHVPSVSLQSERIVQRHINSLALTKFLTDNFSDVLKLRAGWFFTRPDGEVPPAEILGRWLSTGGARKDEWLERGIQELTARSALAGLDMNEVLQRSANGLALAVKGWRREWQSSRDELEAAGGEPTKDKATPAQLAITFQLGRLEQEFLLRVLCSRGFLPSYGFPTQVVPFVTTTFEELQMKRQQLADRGSKDRVDSFGRERGYPSRQIPVAINEYAPGAQLVLDGRVFTSGGVTLNWHIPPGDMQGHQELQSFRVAWRCRDCGSNGTQVNSRNLETCPDCDGSSVKWHPYLEPAGFAVPLSQAPTNNILERTYIPAQRPWVSLSGVNWQVLPVPVSGRFRYSANGQIFSYSGGVQSFGYAICLRCGRASAETGRNSENPPIPRELEGHTPLRGGKNRNMDGLCPGNDSGYAIRRHHLLGSEVQTDVFELQLTAPTTGSSPLGSADMYMASLSIAVALRQAAAEELGIEERELGIAAIRSRRPSGESTFSSVIYDTASGGAGYVALISARLESLLKRTREVLDCSCDRACSSCLLSFDTQHDLPSLDRVLARCVLTDDLVDSLKLSADLQVFGPSSQIEYEPLAAAIQRELQRADVDELRLYLGGDPELWDLPFWPLRYEILRWAQAGTHITLTTAGDIMQLLPPDVKEQFGAFVQAGGIDLRTASHSQEPETLVAEVGGEARHVRFAFTQEASRVPGEDWCGGLEVPDRLIRHIVDAPLAAVGGSVVESADLRDMHKGQLSELQNSSTLDGPISAIGTKLWTQFSSLLPKLRTRLDGNVCLEQITYQDRYLQSPMTLRMLREILLPLSNCSGGVDEQTLIHIVTQRFDGAERSGRFINHDFSNGETRMLVLKTMLQTIAPAVNVECKDRRSAPHARELRLRWRNGDEWFVRFDSGMGFLRPGRDTPFDFHQTGEQQAQAALTRRFLVRQDHRHTAPLLLKTL